MKMDFASELDDLIARAKAGGCDLDTIIADMSGAIDGLNNELQDERDAEDED